MHYDTLEVQRVKNIKEINHFQRTLNLPVLDTISTSKSKMPRVSTRVVKDLQVERHQPQRLAKPSSSSSQLRTSSRSGAWPCGNGCVFIGDNKDALISHLKNTHNFSMVTEHLASRNLALCPYCKLVFEGFTVHMNQCKQPHRAVCQVIGGVFPRKCWSWWSKDCTWYEGTALQTSHHRYFDIEYKGKGLFVEYFHLVTFQQPTPFYWNEDTGAVADEDIESLPFATSPPALSPTNLSLSSVLVACGYDDLIGSPTALRAPQVESKSCLSSVAGAIIIRADGNCLFHLAAIIDDLARDANLLSTGFAPCTMSRLEMVYKQFSAIFDLFRAKLKDSFPCDEDFENEIYGMFMESSADLMDRYSGKTRGQNRLGTSMDLSLFLMHHDIRVVAINANMILRSSSDEELRKACLDLSIVDESEKKRVVCVIERGSHWDIAAIVAPTVKVVFELGHEWEEARVLFLNFVRSRAPLTPGGTGARFGALWEPHPVAASGTAQNVLTPDEATQALPPTPVSFPQTVLFQADIKDNSSVELFNLTIAAACADSTPTKISESSTTAINICSDSTPDEPTQRIESPVSLDFKEPSSDAPFRPVCLFEGTPPAMRVDYNVYPTPPPPPVYIDQLLLPCTSSITAQPDAQDIDMLLPKWFQEKSLLSASFEPSKDCVSALLVAIHTRAKALRAFPPLSLWRWAQKKKWESATLEFQPYFAKALLTDKTSDAFLKLCLRILELPAVILLGDEPEQKGLSEGKAVLSTKLRKVESLTMQNRLHEASKVLMSHGIARPTEALFTRLQALHPPLKEPIPLLETWHDQFSLAPGAVATSLFIQCTEKWHAPDPYGWNTSLLHLIRNIDGEDSFFNCYSTLVSKLIDADVSDLVAFSLTAGSMIGLNKDDPETQQARLDAGLEPRERPINQGSLLLKFAFDLALHSKEAQQAIKKLRPIQQGVGAPRGMELISHVSSTLYEKGYAILKMDATNGFQEIKRSSLHKAVHKRCPSLLSLFQKYYTKESFCFLSLEDEIRELIASEGARIGCKLSSFGFALTVQDAYETVAEIVTSSKDGSCIKTATDDVVIVLKADVEDKQALFTKVHDVTTVLRKEARELGLSFENAKAQFLLPKGWATPPEGTLPEGLVLRSDVLEEQDLRGMIVVGTPIGAASFCHDFIKKTLNDMLRAGENLVELHPQCATKLLKECICAAPSFIAQVCHPDLTKKLLMQFDDRVWELWLKIIGGVSSPELKCCPAVVSRARNRAFLPSRFEGVGIRSWSTASNFAWFTSVACCSALKDRDFNFARRLLDKKAEDAYEMALAAIGGPAYLSEAKFEIIPAGEPDVLINSTFYEDFFVDLEFVKLQHEFMELASEIAHKQFIKTPAHPDDVSERIMLESMKFPKLSASEVANARLSKSNALMTQCKSQILS